VIEYLITHEWFEQEIEIPTTSTILQMRKSKLKKIMDNLEKYYILSCVKIVKKQKYYKINQNSVLVNSLKTIIQKFNLIYAEKVASKKLMH
jgi:hypothetical protein